MAGGRYSRCGPHFGIQIRKKLIFQSVGEGGGRVSRGKGSPGWLLHGEFGGRILAGQMIEFIPVKQKFFWDLTKNQMIEVLTYELPLFGACFPLCIVRFRLSKFAEILERKFVCLGTVPSF